MERDAAADVEILDSKPELLPYFRSINEEWIREMFSLERTDREVLENARALILDRGGRILYARHRELGVVGTCALLRRSGGAFELTKMGVTPSARGRGIGEALLAHAIALTDSLGIAKLFLLTNARCEAAIHLYEKHGFEHDAEVMREYGPLYARCNVAMRLARPPR
jgi:GNAT superfamily N-acetyltransferase